MKNKRNKKPELFTKKVKREMYLAVFLMIATIGFLQLRSMLFDVLSFEGVETREGVVKKTLVFDNIKRSYNVYLPDSYTGNESVPVVFVLHGAGGNAQTALKTTGMDEVSDKNGFIVVYPNGTGVFNDYLLSWNAGDCCNYVEPLGVDDTGFIEFLMDEIIRKYNVDTKKIYVAGRSNGGMMAHRLGCELSDKIAAIAPVSASLTFNDCKPNDYLSVIIFHGADDRVVPFSGGSGDYIFGKIFDVETKSVPDSVLFWVNHNECGLISQKIEKGPIYRENYLGCAENTEVVFYTVLGGHAWPGGGKVLFWDEDPVMNISASETIWQFFAEHPKL